MLASSSRHALKTTQRQASRSILEVCNAHASSSGPAGVQQQRNAATAQASTNNGGLRHGPYAFQPDPRFRRAEGTPLARFNMQIAHAVEQQNWGKAFRLCLTMKRRGVAPDITTYAQIMTACADVGSAREAQATFDDMLAVGIQPTLQIFHKMLHANRYQPSSALLKLVKTMQDRGIKPNEATYEILILRYLSAQQLELALQSLAQMNAAGLSPTLRTAQAVIKTAAALSLPRLALDLADSFEESSIRRLEADVWVDCLLTCAESLWEEGVLRTWQKVVHELNILPDEGLCVQVLHTAGRHGLSALALDAFRVLGRIGVIWQEHHFAPVIEALCKEKRIKDALAMLEMMRSHHIIPLPETTLPISNAVSTNTDAVDTAWGCLEALHEEGRKIDISALNVIVRASVMLGDLQRAVGTYKAAGSLSLSPDVDTYNLLFAGCIAARHRQLGDKLLSEMKEARVRADVRTYERLVALCLTQANYEDAFFYLEEMKAEGHLPPRSVYVALIRKCVKLGDTRYKLALEEMLECGYEVSEALQRFIDSGGEQDEPEGAKYRKAVPRTKVITTLRGEFMKGVTGTPPAAPKSSED
ncbi:uncharacterized protein B0H18DRAFT_976775 [Fomitopsis serialis]|uniref:uncharacterized protein n=1 Tax=Fomitopsis serialis TaxID=139415 RepID=UPI002007BB72|nr:uncharacterized protein B0H18DRAFT_976775 [Neoantrodia serialis]KAH9935671.1 hypothetical protein B0H18DRAFT_976775 [Neoantrodia serialis]